MKDLLSALLTGTSDASLDEIASMIAKIKVKKIAERAAALMAHHQDLGLPYPMPGEQVRCVFDTDEDFTAPGEYFKPVEDAIYSVKASSRDPETREQVLAMMKDAEFPAIALTIISAHPEQAPAYLIIQDDVTNVESLFSYPASAGYIFSGIEPGVGVLSYRDDLKIGDELELTVKTAAGSDFTIGNRYPIKATDQLCSCGKPDCAANGLVGYSLADDDGAEVIVTAPFGAHGTFKVHPKA